MNVGTAVAWVRRGSEAGPLLAISRETVCGAPGSKGAAYVSVAARMARVAVMKVVERMSSVIR